MSTGVGNIHKGQIVYFQSAEILNVDTAPIRLIEVRPAKTDAGWTFSRAVTSLAGSDEVQELSWAGSPQKEKWHLEARSWVPTEGLVVEPGESAGSVKLRFVVSSEPSPELRATNVQVTYERGGKTYVETLEQNMWVSSGDASPDE